MHNPVMRTARAPEHAVHDTIDPAELIPSWPSSSVQIDPPPPAPVRENQQTTQLPVDNPIRSHSFHFFFLSSMRFMSMNLVRGLIAG